MQLVKRWTGQTPAQIEIAWLFSRTINIPPEYGAFLKRTMDIGDAISFECENGNYLWYPAKSPRGAHEMKMRGIGARNIHRKHQRGGV
jgi:hypothetical protein